MPITSAGRAFQRRVLRAASTACAGLLALGALGPAPARAAFDWVSDGWGVEVTMNGHPGSAVVSVELPGGEVRQGNALQVHRVRTPPNDWPQYWVFLTQGSWRQVAPDAAFLTSYHLLRYYSSADRLWDNPEATGFAVEGTDAEGRLRVSLDYRAAEPVSGDVFLLHADLLLEIPDEVRTSMLAGIDTTNASGRDVQPAAENFHGKLRQQWLLFSVDSMYVADNLTETMPSWYPSLDPSAAYVGDTGNASFLDDGHSVSGGIGVSTHDVKFLSAGEADLALDHDMAPVVVPGFDWYRELVLMDAVAPVLWARHGYDPARNHRVEILDAGGIAEDASGLAWCATYNRTDTNMVDGDNVRVSLGLDAFLAATDGVWPAGAHQRVDLRLTAGEPLELRIARDGAVCRVFSNGGRLQTSPNLLDWTDLTGARRRLDVSTGAAAAFQRQNLRVIGR